MQISKTNISESPLVSICIPTYKRYDQLKICLQNAIQQDYENIEILVSDDTNDEPVPDWLLKWSELEPRLRYVKQKITLGMMPNDQFVRKNAKGEYLCIMHNDDEFPRNYVSKMMEVLIANPSVSLVGPSCVRNFNGKHWYDYENYDQDGKNQYDRLADMVNRAFNNPWSIEHLMYGVYRKNTIPETFRFAYWRSIILFLFLCSIKGQIKTVKEVITVKNTNRSDIQKYSAADYVRRYRLFKRFGRRREERLTVLYRLMRFTLLSNDIPLMSKVQLSGLMVWTFLKNRPEVFHPQPALS